MTKIIETPVINFWQPIILPVNESFNFIQKALVSLAAFADQWISLSLKTTEWEIKTVTVKTPAGSSVDEGYFEKKEINNSVEKIIKIFSYIILAPFAAVACGIKALYKYTYVNPYLTKMETLERLDFTQLSFNIQTKRMAIQELSGWFEDHFSLSEEGFSSKREACKAIYPDLFVELENEEAVEAQFQVITNFLIGALTATGDKTALSLRGLTVPKIGPMDLVVTFILHSAWKKAIEDSLSVLSNDPDDYLGLNRYVWNNSHIASLDSWGIYQYELSRRSVHDQALMNKYIKTPNLLLETVKMSILATGSLFSISLQ